MMRHDEALLWEYAARELPAEDARLVQHHLTECPECQEKLTDVRTARGALAAARGAGPSFSTPRSDEAIARAVEKGMSRAALGRGWVPLLASGLLAAGLALAVYGVWSRPPKEQPIATVIPATVPPKVSPTVELATGLLSVGAQTRAVDNGSNLTSGDVLRTAAKGQALLRLPEGTRVKIAGSSQLALTRAEADDVTLSLESGKVAIAASHARRKGFVLHTRGLMVTVVGTSFTVTSEPTGVEIAVAEGRVSVEPPAGLPQFVNAGQRVRYDLRWRSSRSTITVADKRELAALSQVASPSESPRAAAVARTPLAGAPSAGAAPGAAQMQALVNDTVDELAPAPVAALDRPSELPAASVDVAPPPPPAVVAAAPSKPDMTGLEVPLLVSPVESVGRAPTEWAQMPQGKSGGGLAELAVAPTRAAKLGGDEIPEDAEAIFMQRAERSLSHGSCERYLLGLEEIATDRRLSPRAEQARIMRARCFDALMKTKETENEYRRYVREYPRGLYIDEARQVMGGN